MADDRVLRLQGFVAHKDKVTCLALGNKSSVLLTAGEDNSVKLWSISHSETHNILNFRSGHVSPVDTAKFDYSEELVLTGTRIGKVKLWDLQNEKVKRTFSGHQDGIQSLAFHCSGHIIASASADSKIKLWDTKRNGLLCTLKSHHGSVKSLQFSPDGNWIASAGEDSLVKLWDLKTGKLFAEFSTHTAPVNTIDFHPSELLLASGSADRSVKFWDLETYHLVDSAFPVPSFISNVMFHSCGKCLFAAGYNSLQVYGWEPSELLDTIQTGATGIQSVCFTKTKLLLVSCQENIVYPSVIDLKEICPVWRKKLIPREEKKHLEDLLHEKLVSLSNRGKNIEEPTQDPKITYMSKPPARHLVNSPAEPVVPFKSSVTPALTEEETAFNAMEKGHLEMISVLKNRITKLEDTKFKFRFGIKDGINEMLKFDDDAVLIDVLSVLNDRIELWSLDIATSVVEKLLRLLVSQYARYLNISCDSLKLIVTNFGDTIKSNLQPVLGIDIAGEERCKNSKLCIESLKRIRADLKMLQEKHSLESTQKEALLLINVFFSS